jgi:glycosyltransferase involved in cell wall biosynthesis
VLRPSLRVGALPDAGPPANLSELAVMAEPGNVEQLIQGIKFLVDEPQWRSALGRNARARALNRYTWSHHVGAILERLDAVVGLPKAHETS